MGGTEGTGAANHIHEVWRDFKGDFGRDLLADHYENAPHLRKPR